MHARTTLGRGAIITIAMVALLAHTARADLKVAVVDMQKALNECDSGRRAKDQVKSKFIG
jgi:hypothetical protein